MKITDRLDEVIERYGAPTSTPEVDEITRWCQQQIRRCRAIELRTADNPIANCGRYATVK